MLLKLNWINLNYHYVDIFFLMLRKIYLSLRLKRSHQSCVFIMYAHNDVLLPLRSSIIYLMTIQVVIKGLKLGINGLTTPYILFIGVDVVCFDGKDVWGKGRLTTPYILHPLFNG